MMELENVPLNLLPVVEESVLAVKPIADKRNISIQLSTPQKAILVLGDKSGLQQVFINLINNAIKFSPKGSTVEIGVHRTDDQANMF